MADSRAVVRSEEKPRSRGIYLIPNLFTLAALFAGFYAIIASQHGLFEHAAIAILVAAIMDSLDGRVARLLQSQSEFGGQLDSLSDMICFGLAPALLLYTWSLSALGKIGWLVAFIYTACTALRLARFNTQMQNPDKRFFQGLATTAAAPLVASGVWAAVENGLVGSELAIVSLCVALVLSVLKVSSVKYRSFKDFDVRQHVPFVVLLDPPDVLCVVGALYVLSGPVEAGIQGLRTRRPAGWRRRG